MFCQIQYPLLHHSNNIRYSRTIIQPYRRKAVQTYRLQSYSRTAVQTYRRKHVQTTAVQKYSRTDVQSYIRTEVQPYRRTHHRVPQCAVLSSLLLLPAPYVCTTPSAPSSRTPSTKIPPFVFRSAMPRHASSLRCRALPNSSPFHVQYILVYLYLQLRYLYT